MNGQPPPVSPAVPRKTSGLAIASLVLGILGLTCILPIIGPILALVFGIVALNRISKSGETIKGHGQAIAGLVLGGVGLVVVPIIVAMLLPALGTAREPTRQVVCFSNVKQIGIAWAMYADQHNGKLPQDFDDLKGIITSTKVFICPSARDQSRYSYEFTGLTNVWGVSSNVVILREIEANHRGRRVLLYNDGHVEIKPDK
jgi:hypothetical protein